jgi:hypothetical protein
VLPVQVLDVTQTEPNHRVLQTALESRIAIFQEAATFISASRVFRAWSCTSGLFLREPGDNSIVHENDIRANRFPFMAAQISSLYKCWSLIFSNNVSMQCKTAFMQWSPRSSPLLESFSVVGNGKVHAVRHSTNCLIEMRDPTSVTVQSITLEATSIDAHSALCHIGSSMSLHCDDWRMSRSGSRT